MSDDMRRYYVIPMGEGRGVRVIIDRQVDTRSDFDSEKAIMATL